eukprot:NODE_498_length_6794_cov_0.318250.p2 type:complete len:359 gc:universal NODE_498_length_6794_cov_0.318250:2941-4017(+)
MKLLSILHSPKFFKEELDALISTSKRVKLTSLYLGQHITNKGQVIVDGNRSKRESKHHPNTLYYNTSKVKHYLPNQLKELGELFHCKCYIFDKHVILSGANLSSNYFTNRQDRYILINNHHFADMMDEWYQLMVNTHAITPTNQFIQFHKPSVHSLQKWAAFQVKKLENTLKHTPSGTHIIPILNWPQINIKHDILTHLQQYYQNNQFTISTAYFNPTQQLHDMIHSGACVIAPDISTHGFFNGNGLKQYIPLLYQHFINPYPIYTYKRPNYSFHAKGIWIKPNLKSNHYLTVIGSNNYGYRSQKDVELDFVILSDDLQVKEALELELQEIQKYCHLQQPMKLPFWIKLASRMGKRIL